MLGLTLDSKQQLEMIQLLSPNEALTTLLTGCSLQEPSLLAAAAPTPIPTSGKVDELEAAAAAAAEEEEEKKKLSA